MALDPFDNTVTNAELYRLITKMDTRLDALAGDMRQNKLSVDVYNIAHTALQQRVTDLETAKDRYEQQKVTYRTQMSVALASATLAFAFGLATLVLKLIGK